MDMAAYSIGRWGNEAMQYYDVRHISYYNGNPSLPRKSLCFYIWAFTIILHMRIGRHVIWLTSNADLLSWIAKAKQSQNTILWKTRIEMCLGSCNLTCLLFYAMRNLLLRNWIHDISDCPANDRMFLIFCMLLYAVLYVYLAQLILICVTRPT